MEKKHIALSLALAAALYGRYQWNASKQVVYEDPEENVIQKKREPASAKLKHSSKPQPRLASSDEKSDSPSPEASKESEESGDQGDGQGQGQGQGKALGSSKSDWSGHKGRKSNHENSGESDISRTKPQKPGDEPTPPTNPKQPDICPGGICTSVFPLPEILPPPPETKSLSCSSSIGGGAYSYPISVGLSCSSESTIKYCVSTGGCCDPKTAGTPYTANVVVGAPEGSYCVSFYGETPDGVESKIMDYTYTIDSTAPDLVTAHVKTFYQTTELLATSAPLIDPLLSAAYEPASTIKSADFGKIGFETGVLSLQANPNSMTCEQIVAGAYTPAPVVVMNPFSTSALTTSSELKVPLVLNHLIYGDNFITSYVVNSNFAADLYSCSTTTVRLEDFAYFEMGINIPSGATAVPKDAEFVSGFYAYRFADAPTVTRGPASEDVSGQKLDINLFSIFY